MLALIPSTISFGDLGALLVRQPGVTARAQKYLIASPFGTIHAATFSMPRPIGTAIPHPPVYALANFDPSDIAVSIGAQLLGDPTTPLRFPTVNRKDKRDSLISRARQPMPPLPPALPIEPVTNAQAEAPLKNDETAGRFDPYTEYEFAAAPDEQPAAPDAALPHGDFAPYKQAAPSPHKPKDAAQVYFGAAPIAAGQEAEAITPWAPGEAPVVKAPSGDPDIKMAALEPYGKLDEKGGQSIANKGEVTGSRSAPEIAGRAAGAHRRGVREGREVSHQRRLFRSTRRGGARPDRGRAGGDEPRVLAVLSQRRLRRGPRAQQPRLPVQL